MTWIAESEGVAYSKDMLFQVSLDADTNTWMVRKNTAIAPEQPWWEPFASGFPTMGDAKLAARSIDPVLVAHAADAIERITGNEDKDATASQATLILALDRALEAATALRAKDRGADARREAYDAWVSRALDSLPGAHDKKPQAVDTWLVYASSGEYLINAGDMATAIVRFTATHRDDYILAIVCEGIDPPLMPESNVGYALSGSQADWITDILRTAMDPDSGVIDTTSGGGYRGESLERLQRFLADTVRSIQQQREGGEAVLADFMPPR